MFNYAQMFGMTLCNWDLENVGDMNVLFDGSDDSGNNDSDNDDLIKLMVGGEERMGSINKFGLTVGEVVVLLDA